MDINDIINEGLYDQHIFKAVFMVGGPGSGKTYVASKLFRGTGLRTVNLDDIYEHLTANIGIVGRGYDEYLRKYSAQVAQRKMNMHVDGRMGLLIDSTGRKLNRMRKINEKLKDLGYDTLAIYVKTSLEIALDRSESRRRRVDPRESEKMHEEVKSNISQIRKIFRNFVVINNDSSNDLQNSISKNQSYINKFLSAPINHHAANAWKSEQQDKRRL